MSFIVLVLKNLLRQKVRTALTVLGISIGITTVVALGVVIEGMKQSAGQVLRAYNADFMVAQKGAADLSFSTIPEDEANALAARDDVARVVPALFHIGRVAENPYFFLLGVRPEDLPGAGVDLAAGALLTPGAGDEIMLGSGAADALHAAVGDTLTIERTQFRVVGIYRAQGLWEKNGAYAQLPTVQQIARKPGSVTVVYVEVAPGRTPADVATAIERDFSTLTAILNVGEYGDVDQGIRIIDAVNLAISALTVGIGAIGVMNTMVMSVFERTREIGILRAVGWRGSRILRMIIAESLLLCAIAAVTGSLLGVLASRLVLLIPLVRNFLEPVYTVDIFARALVVAVIVAIAGAAYPAIRAVRLTPMEALRHE